MTRKIKFKVEDKETNYHLGYEILEDDEWWFYPRGSTKIRGVYRLAARRRQYTGLKDKNEKEIYEWDIIESKFENIYRKIKYIGYVIYTKWLFTTNPISWYGYNKRTKRSIPEIITMNPLAGDTRNCKIIGTIYENPEKVK